MATKTCIKCGGTWPISFFYIHRKGKKRARCIGCQQRTNAETYRLNRKAHNSIARHARSFGLEKSKFAEQFGWDATRMAEDLAHALNGKCPYCLKPNSDPLKLTFDILNPSMPPHYSANVRICCSDCNCSKKLMSPDAWAERLKTWQEYRKWIAEIEINPLFQLPLFQE